MNEALKDSEDEHRKHQPHHIREKQGKREQDGYIDRLCQMGFAGYESGRVDTHHRAEKCHQASLKGFFILVANQQKVDAKNQFTYDSDTVPVTDSPHRPAQEDESHDVDVVLKEPKTYFLHNRQIAIYVRKVMVFSKHIQ